MEMKHFKHEHSLILNEVYIAREGDECYICEEKIVSCKSFVYSCTRVNSSDEDYRCVNFLLHKSCAELPPTIQNPSNDKQSLSLRYSTDSLCNVCGIQCRGFGYRSGDYKFSVCLVCALFPLQSLVDRKFHHPAHSQHTLFLLQHPSSIRCYACKIESDIKDLSYICTECPFWMHKSCADAPASFSFPFHHKHPLILSFHLPQVYHKFVQHCKLCRKTLQPRTGWLYYCPKCRFFAHFHCARSSQMVTSSSEDETYPDLVHLPPADSSSATNVLVEQFVKAMSTLNHNIIFDETRTIKHRVDCEHHLQLITYNELSDQKDDDNDKILLCDCCVKPIPTDGNQFYGCVSCKYFLHRDCAKLPSEIENFSGQPGLPLSADKHSEPFMFFYCDGCGGLGNGIFFCGPGYKFHIGCTVLPEKIKHEAHIHQLDRVSGRHDCDACGRQTYVLHRCETCNVCICEGCLMRARTDKHPWDPHPLHLIYEAEMVTDDHEHDFGCEFCSKEINTNYWFYHCSACDLSFHLDCFGKSCYRFYSNIKFGSTDIIIHQLHPHGLTLILNKKVRSCKLCGVEQLGEPVLECTPCKIIFCRSCSKRIFQIYYKVVS